MPDAPTPPTRTTPPLVELHGLRKIFRDFWGRPRVAAVQGIDLAVHPGEIFGLLGPNGSGKSTTLKMILGLLRPSGGSATVFGYPPRDRRARARLGYLPEITCLHPFLTPTETLRYYADLSGLEVAASRERIAQLLAMFELENVAGRPVGDLSKGMARRVALAQALVNRPDLLVLDEPTSGLDPVACRGVKDLLPALARLGTTVLMTSHLLADVEDVCDRVAIMDNGTIRASGPVRDLLRRPDAVRFLVEGLTEDEIASLRGEIASRTGRGVGVDHPAMDLETFFLQTVAGNGPRSGAGARVAPFLLADRAAPAGGRKGGAP
jgi:ABC-2 type transport system ATP-binding protein